MKKIIKIILIILLILLIIIIADTIQSKVFNNSPIIKKITAFNWEKYSIKFLKQENDSSNNKWQEEYKKYSKTIDDVTLELNIPNGWKYEEILPKKDCKSIVEEIELDNYKFALKIYKDSEEKNLTLYVRNSPIGVCGTFLVNKSIKLDNGENASVSYYDGSNIWSFISFSKSNIMIFISNNGLEESESNEALEFVKTMNIQK